MMAQKLDFADPLIVRKWLNILIEDPALGLALPPGICLPKKRLGFDFRTNEIGHRGPFCVSDGKVILGTSYAMGFSVDTGENWYELDTFYGKYLNLGFPVGIRQLANRLNQFGKARKELIFLYHPNMPVLTAAYENARSMGVGIFEYFRWTTNLKKCVRMAIRHRLTQRSNPKYVFVRSDGEEFRCSVRYCVLSDEDRELAFGRLNSDLDSLFESFEKVFLVRCRTKEEVCFEAIGEPRLQQAHKEHVSGWEKVKSRYSAYSNVVILEWHDSAPGDFLPFDTHWSVAGNKKFSRSLREELSNSSD